MDIKKALEELRKNEKRNFDQTIDLIVNLKKIDIKRDQFSLILSLPNKFKDKKVCGFLVKKSPIMDTITEIEFKKYQAKSELKKIVKKYDFFISAAPLMPKVASTFGKILGPAGKMPSPQLGLVNSEDKEIINSMLDKIGRSLKIRLKENSIKIPIGKESMDDEKIEENAKNVYKAVKEALPRKKENIKSLMLKFTMTKPVRMEIP